MILTITTEQIPQSRQLIEELDRIKNEGVNIEIRRKAKSNILLLEDLLKEEEIRKDLKIETGTKSEGLLSQTQKELQILLENEQFHKDQIEISDDEWLEMKKELEKEEKGTAEQIEEIQQQKIKIYRIIVSAFVGTNGDNKRKKAIEVGIIDILLRTFTTLPLDRISPYHAWTFFEITYTNAEVNSLLIKKKALPSIFRLLDHKDISIVNRSVISIRNILSSSNSSFTDTHPQFEEVEACGGIDKLFEIFKRNVSKYSKDNASFCIALLFRTKQIEKEIIAHLISLSFSLDESLRQLAKQRLIELSQNKENKEEIEKRGYILPEDQ
ncbi:MAG: hypothetical protein EZS28_009450 [Streblomastix strix]|uniref:Uncharacterized protein n=1 Tax=Streblomastix strix TaxID=222440 RepID=A0A5J4WJ46_9EUKA|nr:MAG: hypothetical protein EZS28_009450 [Streblomastix strix]